MKRWLKLIVGILLLLALFSFVDWRAGLDLFRQISPLPIFAAVGLFPVALWISAQKWRLFLEVQGIDVSTWHLFKYYWIGAFFNNFLPSSVGGDISRIALLQKTGRSSQVAASIVIERACGVVLLLFFALMAVIFRPEFFPGGSGRVVGIFSLGLLFFFLFLYIWAEKIIKSLDSYALLESDFLFSFFAKLKNLVISILFYHGENRSILNGLFWSILFLFISIFAQYMLFIAFGLDIRLEDVLFVLPIINLVSFIPISINALGLAEGAFVFFYSQAGVQPSEALAVAMLARILRVLLSSIGGVFLLFEKR